MNFDQNLSDKVHLEDKKNKSQPNAKIHQLE